MKSETRRLNKLKDTSRNLAKRYKLSEAALRIIEKAGTKPKVERERASRAIRHLLDLSTSAGRGRVRRKDDKGGGRGRREEV